MLITAAWAASACLRAQPRGRVTAAAVFGLGLVAEVVGVTTGFPFGAYSYSTAWQPTVSLWTGQPFPLLVPVAWVTVVCYCWAMVPKGWGRVQSATAVAILAAFVDLPMEFVMTKALGYWSFSHTSPPFWSPLSNTLGWFAVAWIAGWLLGSTQAPRRFRSDALLVGGTFQGFLAVVSLTTQFSVLASVMLGVLSTSWFVVFACVRHSAQKEYAVGA